MPSEIQFWNSLRELNELTTILSINCPEYEERVSKLKRIITPIIVDHLELSKEVAKLEKKFIINSRNN